MGRKRNAKQRKARKIKKEKEMETLMEINTYMHHHSPGFISTFTFIEPTCLNLFSKINLMPDSIESWSESKGYECHCGKSQYKGKYDITTKSGQHYTIVEHPDTLTKA